MDNCAGGSAITNNGSATIYTNKDRNTNRPRNIRKFTRTQRAYAWCDKIILTNEYDFVYDLEKRIKSQG